MKYISSKLNLIQVPLLLSLLTFSSMMNAEVVVIVNSSSSTDILSTNEVKKIFLGKKKKLPNGDTVKPLEQAVNSDVRKQFNIKVLAKSERKLKFYWSKIIFSGKGVPPPKVNGSDEVKRWLAENKNGIAYIDSSQVDESVKVVLTVK